MNAAPISLQFNATNAIINPKTGIPSSGYGWQFFLGLQQRTGGGTGIFNSVSGPLTATGSAIIDALPLSNDWNLVANASAGSGVQLPNTMAPGCTCKVRNNGAGNLLIYPPTALFQIDALGFASPYTLAPNTEIEFECWTTTQLYSR